MDAPSHLEFEEVVWLEVTVQADGTPKDFVLLRIDENGLPKGPVRSSGVFDEFPVSPELANLAVTAILSGSASPARRDGQLVDQRIRTGVVFNSGRKLDSKPKIKHWESPDYPEFHRANAIQGVVLVEVLVGESGAVLEARVLKSVDRLDSLALEAAKKATFEPAVYKGERVRVWTLLPYKFKVFL